MNRYFSCFGISGKIVLTGLLSAFALALLVTDPSLPRLLCAAGMLLSTLGDLALMEESAFGKGLRAPSFFTGVCFFALAHIAYFAAYWTAATEKNALSFNSGTKLGLLLYGLALGLLLVLATANRSGLGLVLLCAVYLTILSSNCVLISTYAAARGGLHYLCMAGALCFFLSDCLIGVKVLGGLSGDALARVNTAIWWLYPIGQILMILFVA